MLALSFRFTFLCKKYQYHPYSWTSVLMNQLTIWRYGDYPHIFLKCIITSNAEKQPSLYQTFGHQFSVLGSQLWPMNLISGSIWIFFFLNLKIALDARSHFLNIVLFLEILTLFNHFCQFYTAWQKAEIAELISKQRFNITSKPSSVF